ncbi:MAG: hypothetical protein WBM99_02975, partial [Psychromonas sp.]
LINLNCRSIRLTIFLTCAAQPLLKHQIGMHIPVHANLSGNVVFPLAKVFGHHKKNGRGVL